MGSLQTVHYSWHACHYESDRADLMKKSLYLKNIKAIGLTLSFLLHLCIFLLLLLAYEIFILPSPVRSKTFLLKSNSTQQTCCKKNSKIFYCKGGTLVLNSFHPIFKTLFKHCSSIICSNFIC